MLDHHSSRPLLNVSIYFGKLPKNSGTGKGHREFTRRGAELYVEFQISRCKIGTSAAALFISSFEPSG
jgi:hypothetical protein